MTTNLARNPAPALPAPSPAASLHFVDDAGVLFDGAARRLYALNPAAAFLWCCLEEGFGRDATLARLSRTFAFDRTAAERHLDDMLAEWRRLGLVDRPADAAPAPCEATPPPETMSAAGPPPADAGPVHRLLDMRFHLRATPPALLDDLAPLLAHLRQPADAAAAPVLDLEETGAGFVLRCGRQVLARWIRRDELVPWVKGGLVRLALEHSRDFLALHTAGAGVGGRCVLLPGASGSGKSTLAAALAARGMPLFGDDTVVLAADTLEARPVPLGVCLKPGSWELHRATYPFLDRLPVHHRPDGKSVRYVVPPGRRAVVDADARAPVAAVLFPVRTARPGAEIVSLARGAALARLLDGGCPLGPPLDRRKIGRLVDWIGGLSCGELRYGSLDAAADKLSELGACFR